MEATRPEFRSNLVTEVEAMGHAFLSAEQVEQAFGWTEDKSSVELARDFCRQWELEMVLEGDRWRFGPSVHI